MSYSPIVESVVMNFKCKKVGHDNQPLSFVCLLPNLKEHLYCSNCLLTDQSHNEKQMVSYKTFLETHLTHEKDLQHHISKNKQYIEMFAHENNQLEMIRKDEERLVDDLFNNLSKQMRILLDNTRDKFKYFFKNHYEKIHKIVDEVKDLEQKNILPPLKDLLTKANFNDQTGVSAFFELLIKNQINLNPNLPEIEELITKIPKVSQEKFKKAEVDIMIYTKERLKKLLEFHVIFFKFL